MRQVRYRALIALDSRPAEPDTMHVYSEYGPC
jgi:hypothetical protein